MENPIVKNWDEIEDCFKFLHKRLTGETKTLARYMRDFVLSHDKYRQDSIVSEEIAYELLYELQLISDGKLESQNFATPFTGMKEEK